MHDRRPVTVGHRVDAADGGHVHLSVFVGRQPGARGRAGNLVLRTDELLELLSRGLLDLGGELYVRADAEDDWQELLAHAAELAQEGR